MVVISSYEVFPPPVSLFNQSTVWIHSRKNIFIWSWALTSDSDIRAQTVYRRSVVPNVYSVCQNWKDIPFEIQVLSTCTPDQVVYSTKMRLIVTIATCEWATVSRTHPSQSMWAGGKGRSKSAPSSELIAVVSHFLLDLSTRINVPVSKCQCLNLNTKSYD